MRLAHSTPDLIQLRGRGSVGTPLLVGCILLCWPALAAALADTAPTSDRLLAAGVLMTVAAGLIRLGWPRVRLVTLRPKARTAAVDGGPPILLGEDAALRLVAAPAQPVAGPLRYGVTLETRSALPVLLLVGEDPAAVLREVAMLRKCLPLPVCAGWGLARNAFPLLDEENGHSDGSFGAWRKDDPVEPTRRRATTALGIGCAGAAALIVLEIRGRASRGDVASPISLVLPALGVLILTCLTLVSGSLRPHVSVGTALLCEWRLGALRLFKRRLDTAKIRGVHLVSPSGNTGRHLLVDTVSDEFVAFPCNKMEGAAAAARLARPIHGGGPEISSMAPRHSRS